MASRPKKREKFALRLESAHEKELSVAIYAIGVFLVFLFYLFMYFLFAGMIATVVVTIFSLGLGLYIAYNRVELMKLFEENISERRRRHYKRRENVGLQETIRSLRPKENFFSIKKRIISSKLASFKKAFPNPDQRQKQTIRSSKKINSEKYVEIK
ncbi:hypothetical protein H6501_01090 [Candidatus Woesearchaeota archaeon]|nr:hypothetical protein [Nanoarchaeota archaeon]MCB9370171.1 hypothetical protein [Candidatus Woesearchaeota archaeon]USN44701.1 MAG: hypothetical protein H6500_02565 [Candidatus Woesearchaeota archaeon]